MKSLHDICVEAVLAHDYWRVHVRYLQYLDPETINRLANNLYKQGRLRPHQLPQLFPNCTRLHLELLNYTVQQQLSQLTIKQCPRLRPSHLASLTSLHASLTKLDLSDNKQLNDDVGPIIATLTRLDTLIMNGTSIVDEAVQDILLGCTNLRVLHANDCDSLNSSAFARMGTKCTHLEELQLMDTPCMDNSLLNHIQHLPNLSTLVLAKWQLTWLPTSPTSLRALHLQDLQLEFSGPWDEPFMPPALEELVVNEASLKSNEARHLLLLLLQCTTSLQRLCIHSAELSDEEEDDGQQHNSNALTLQSLAATMPVNLSHMTALHLHGATLLPAINTTHASVLCSVVHGTRRNLVDTIATYCPQLRQVHIVISNRQQEPCMLTHALKLAAMPHLEWMWLADGYEMYDSSSQALYKFLASVREHGFTEAMEFAWFTGTMEFPWEAASYRIGLHAPGRLASPDYGPWLMPDDDRSTHMVDISHTGVAGIIVEHMLELHSSVEWVLLDCVHNPWTWQRLALLPNLKSVALQGWQPQCDITGILQQIANSLDMVFLDFTEPLWEVFQQEGWVTKAAALGWCEAFCHVIEGEDAMTFKMVPHFGQPNNVPALALGTLTQQQHAECDQRYRYTREELLQLGARGRFGGTLPQELMRNG